MPTMAEAATVQRQRTRARRADVWASDRSGPAMRMVPGRGCARQRLRLPGAPSWAVAWEDQCTWDAASGRFRDARDAGAPARCCRFMVAGPTLVAALRHLLASPFRRLPLALRSTGQGQGRVAFRCTAGTDDSTRCRNTIIITVSRPPRCPATGPPPPRALLAPPRRPPCSRSSSSRCREAPGFSRDRCHGDQRWTDWPSPACRTDTPRADSLSIYIHIHFFSNASSEHDRDLVVSLLAAGFARDNTPWTKQQDRSNIIFTTPSRSPRVRDAKTMTECPQPPHLE